MKARSLLAVPLGIAAFLATPSADAGIKLKRIEFPIGAGDTSGPETPPADAPLSQRVVFVFDDKPKLGPAVADALRIRVGAANLDGQTPDSPAIGAYTVKGKKVVFTPRLPTASLAGFGPTSDVSAEAALPGLLPGTEYEVTIDPDVDDGVKNLTKIGGGVPAVVPFVTVPLAPPAAALATYFSNFGAAAPELQNKGVDPKPDLEGLHPNLFSDPAGLFLTIPVNERPPFRLRFEGPRTPDADAVAAASRLRATAAPDGAPVDVPLTVTTALVSNTVDGGAEVLVFPTGVLPLAHGLVLELSDALESIDGTTAGAGAPAAFGEVAGYTVAASPNGGAPIDDATVETFDTKEFEDPSVALEGVAVASWNEGGSGHLRATSSFGGPDALGPFEAPPWDDLILLDTDHQTFPLFNGATPLAKPGTVVTDGVFRFSSFHLPAGVTLRAVGSNPLVITCTESCLIEGTIDVSGRPGASSLTFDSSIAPVAGGSSGAGGGRGGDGHPVAKPLPGAPLTMILSPEFGGSGEGPGGVGLGGGGGQSGCTLPWSPFAVGNCSGFASTGDGSRGSGGGGGSFATFLPDAPETFGVPISGRGGGIGLGDHLPVPFDPEAPVPPAPAAYDAQPGNPTNAVAMPNPNFTFAEAVEAGTVFDEDPRFDINSPWAQSRRVTLPGAAGPAVFSDGDPENDFIGPGGEVPSIRGGQGGGAGASRTEGLSRECVPILAASGLPGTVLDASGGAGGGGAGAVLIRALGTIALAGPDAAILAVGGDGGGGEGTGTSSRGGAGGGGSGGAVVLQSATNVEIDDPLLAETVVDVSGGCYANAINLSS
ncbi:MAG: hypothetical protein ACF8XB_04835, partial [Planctomycetota bacterium JB042]